MARERSAFLDVLRGAAILGILPVNVAFFAYPGILAGEPSYPAEGGAAGAAAVRAVHFLFEGKFVTIFALLFGAGMVLLRERTLDAGGRWVPVVVRRLGALWLLGCAHALLLWYGDIAAYYAILGFAVFWAPGRPPADLRRWGTALVLLPLVPVLLALGFALAGHHGVTEWMQSLDAQVPDGRGGFSPLAFDPDDEIATFRGGTFGAGVLLRFAYWITGAVGVLPLWGPRLAGLFLLGMALAREAWFLDPASAEGRRRFGRWLVLGLAVGLPLTTADLLLGLLAPESAVAGLDRWISQYVGSLALAFAIVSLVARAWARWPASRAVAALSAVGRTAFSNYLLQSAVLALLFQGSTVFLGAGFGLFARLGRWEALGIAAALAAAQLGASVLWLRAFRMGPVEWAWRAATYLRWPEMRRGGR